jgi:hypothetical protein
VIDGQIPSKSSVVLLRAVLDGNLDERGMVWLCCWKRKGSNSRLRLSDEGMYVSRALGRMNRHIPHPSVYEATITEEVKPHISFKNVCKLRRMDGGLLSTGS